MSLANLLLEDEGWRFWRTEETAEGNLLVLDTLYLHHGVFQHDAGNFCFEIEWR